MSQLFKDKNIGLLILEENIEKHYFLTILGQRYHVSVYKPGKIEERFISLKANIGNIFTLPILKSFLNIKISLRKRQIQPLAKCMKG